MLHLSLTKKTQGNTLFTVAPDSSSTSRYCAWKLSGLIPRYADIRLISSSVKIGVMVLQQCAHSVQFTSRHTLASSSATISDKSGGIISSNFFRNNVSFFRSRFAAFNIRSKSIALVPLNYKKTGLTFVFFFKKLSPNLKQNVPNLGLQAYAYSLCG